MSDHWQCAVTTLCRKAGEAEADLSGFPRADCQAAWALPQLHLPCLLRRGGVSRLAGFAAGEMGFGIL